MIPHEIRSFNAPPNEQPITATKDIAAPSTRGAKKLALRDKYDCVCPKCRAEQSIEPSINMHAGINSACILCLRCSALLHVEIAPDLMGATARAELQVAYIARKCCMDRQAGDGG